MVTGLIASKIQYGYHLLFDRTGSLSSILKRCCILLNLICFGKPCPIYLAIRQLKSELQLVRRIGQQLEEASVPDPNLHASKFIHLVKTACSIFRPAHDGLYRAINIYLKSMVLPPSLLWNWSWMVPKTTPASCSRSVVKNTQTPSQSPLRRYQRKNQDEVPKENQKCRLMSITGKKQVVAEGQWLQTTHTKEFTSFHWGLMQ